MKKKIKQVMLVQDEANKKSNLIFIFLLLCIILFSQVISAADTYPVTVRPKTGGALQPNNYFEYVFNFTTDSACTSVLSSKSAGITTDAYGIGATELDLSGLTQSPSYLCEYRNTSLRKVHNISMGMFDNVFGSGVNLTENLTIDINTFFVNSANNRVGIGTISPESIFHTKTSLGDNRFIVQSGGSNEAIFDLVSGGTGTRFFYRDSDDTFGIWHDAIWNESTGTLSGGTTKFRMQSDGNIVLNEGGGKVGVGTTTPDGLVHLETSGLNATDTADVGQYALIIHDKNGANDKEVGIGFSMFTDGAVVDTTDAPGAAITHERTGSWSAGKLHFKTRNSISESGNPVTRMTIDEDGRVGIGTSTPSTKLEVNGDVNLNDTFYVNSSGNVGIGTSNPTEKLDVRNGTIRVGYDADTFDQLIEFYRNNIKIGVIDNDGSDIRLRAQNGNDVKIGDDAGTKLIVKDGGNVGIGTISPDMKLEIEGTTSNSPATSGTSQNGSLRLSNSGNNLALDFGQTSSSPWGTWIQSTDKGNLATEYNLLLNPNGGKVGIGTTDPKQTFDFPGNQVRTQSYMDSDVATNLGVDTFGAGTMTGDYNNAFGRSALYSVSSGTNNNGFGSYSLENLQDGINNVAVGSSALRQVVSGENNIGIGYRAGDVITTGGHNIMLGYRAGNGVSTGSQNINIGAYANWAGNYDNTITIGYNLDAPGDRGLNIGNLIFGTNLSTAENISTGNVGIGTSTPGSYKLYISGADAYCDQATCWNDASDISMKRDIRDSDYGLFEILQLKPRKYRYIKDDVESFGLIAQEVELIIPEVVSGEEGTKGIAYGSLTPVLIKAIQEQQEQIEALAAGRNLDVSIGNQTMPMPIETESLSLINLVVSGLAQFKDIIVSGHVTFGKDNVGQAVILEGNTEVNVRFEKEYDNIPIVILTPIGLHDVNYGLGEISSAGFKIIIDSPQSKDIVFNWHAFDGDGNVVVSANPEYDEDNPVNNITDSTQNQSTDNNTIDELNQTIVIE